MKKIILIPFLLLYRIIIDLRNWFYQAGIFKSQRLACKVISVGNISIGGTGKTPTVFALAKWLQEQNKAVAILSRGYKRKSKGTQLVSDGKSAVINWKLVGDEPMLLAKALPNVPIVVDKNRVRGGQYLVNNFNPDIILLDDGFQHRKLARDINIVLINSSDKKQDHRLFPLGKLREPWSALQRADIILLSKSNLQPPSEYLLNRLNNLPVQYFSTSMDTGNLLIDSNGEKLNINVLKGKKVTLFTGIGDPQSFLATVIAAGAETCENIIFADHHEYSTADLKKIKSSYNNSGSDFLLTTEKDLIKIEQTELPIFALRITITIDPNGIKHIRKLIS